MRFSVTCRTIDENARDQILNGSRAKVLGRQAGQKFLLYRERSQRLTDEAESESSEHEEEDDEAGVVKNKPVPRKPGLMRGFGRTSSRSSVNRSRSASPSGKRKQRRNGSPVWPPEDDEMLRE
jgi:hypothetical protein